MRTLISIKHRVILSEKMKKADIILYRWRRCTRKARLWL